MSESMIKRVAEAIKLRACEDRPGDSMLLEEWGGWGGEEDFVSIAIAAIAAMREPIQEMYAAHGIGEDEMKAFTIMIDAALAGGRSDT